jgi:uncharacterized low-complexity protein
MIRKLVLGATAAAVLAVPGTALAAKPHYKVGQKCTAKNAMAYKAAHFKCVKGKLVATK